MPSTKSGTRPCGRSERFARRRVQNSVPDVPVLEGSGLSVDYVLDRGDVRAVDDVSFTLDRGEFLGIVGESGCGKSTLLFAVAQLLSPPARVAEGSVKVQGTEMVGLTDQQLSAIRWRDVSTVMQSAMNGLQ